MWTVKKEIERLEKNKEWWELWGNKDPVARDIIKRIELRLEKLRKKDPETILG